MLTNFFNAQVTCHLKMRRNLRFVHTLDGEIGEVQGLRLNFYGVKSEAQYTTIKVRMLDTKRHYIG